MKNYYAAMLCSAILFVGLVNAYVIYKGITDFNKIFYLKEFRSSSSQYSPPSVVSLSPNNFAIVDGIRVSIYQVDRNGKLKRMDDVYTDESQLKAIKRPTPQPSPTPIPSPLPTSIPNNAVPAP